MEEKFREWWSAREYKRGDSGVNKSLNRKKISFLNQPEDYIHLRQRKNLDQLLFINKILIVAIKKKQICEQTYYIKEKNR